MAFLSQGEVLVDENVLRRELDNVQKIKGIDHEMGCLGWKGHSPVTFWCYLVPCSGSLEVSDNERKSLARNPVTSKLLLAEGAQRGTASSKPFRSCHSWEFWLCSVRRCNRRVRVRKGYIVRHDSMILRQCPRRHTHEVIYLSLCLSLSLSLSLSLYFSCSFSLSLSLSLALSLSLSYGRTSN